MSTLSIPQDFRSWPIAQRLELVEQVWDSIIDEGAQLELTDLQKAEVDRRLSQYGAAPNRGFSWEEVKARILAR